MAACKRPTETSDVRRARSLTVGSILWAMQLVLACAKGPDAAACEEAKRACQEKYEDCDVWRPCGVPPSGESALIETTLLAGCEEGRVETCRILMRHYREGELRNHFDADKRKRAVEATCKVKPEVVCELVRDPELDNMGIEDQVSRGEDALICDEAPVRKCVLEASTRLLTQSMADADGLGERTYALLEEACIADGGAACDAAYVKVKPTFDSEAPEPKAFPFLKRACDAKREHQCGLLARGCAGEGAGCDLDEMKKRLNERCLSAACMAEAVALFPDIYVVRACAAGHANTCASDLIAVAKTEGSIWAERFKEHCKAHDEVGCYRWASAFFTKRREWELAVPFLKAACERGSKETCELLPYVQVELPKPDNRPGLDALDERCRGDDGPACFRLAEIYKFGEEVLPNPSRSSSYAEKACASAKTKTPAPEWKDSACSWKGELPKPVPGRPSTDPVSALMRAITSPFMILQ